MELHPKRGASDFARIQRAIEFIQSRVREQPSLEEIAAELGLSAFHFQRLFQRWAGVSPKAFLQFLTLQQAKRLLQDSRSLLDVSFELGLSGPSRLHDLFLKLERLTPGEFKSGAHGMVIRWGIEPTPLGPALFATSDRGLCGVSFAVDPAEKTATPELTRRWEGATLVHDPSAIRAHAAAFRARMNGDHKRPLSLLLKGTPLQLKVWEALLRIPPAQVTSYSDVALRMGLPKASRAVGTAISQNPIAYLIPCHRVIQSTGAFGQYRWGATRKIALLGLEQAGRMNGLSVRAQAG